MEGNELEKKENDLKEKKHPLKSKTKQTIKWLCWPGIAFSKGDILTKLSFVIMGSGNLLRGQIVKGLWFLLAELSYLLYMIRIGVGAFAGLPYLGTTQQGWVYSEELGIDILQQGDNSMLILLYGVVAIFVTIAFIVIWRTNIKASLQAQRLKEENKPLPSFFEDVRSYFDSKLHSTLMFFPTLGIVLFTILPLSFMILIAFTNYDNNHQPPGNLFSWVGLKNFKTILLSGDTIANTFWPVLGWTIVWAIFATGLNYIFGMLLAMLINRDGVKLKKFWRTIFVLSIAVPQFISLLVMRTMLNDDGAINVLLKDLGIISKTDFLPFLSNPTWARVTVLVVNLWVGIPYTMLITTGILMNIPRDLYESAKVDGASWWVSFRKITLPYVLFVTTPYLITQFVGNMNNFNVIYFLTGGGPASLEYYQAGKTDLLVTWLYKLTTGAIKDYNYAATIGILVFILSAVFSLLTYRRTSSYKNEEGFQ